MNPLESLLDWLLAATLRASALAVIILGIQLLLRRWLPAQWRYALWLPMLLVLVLPALPVVPFGLFPWKSAESVAVISASAPTLSTATTSQAGKVLGTAVAQSPVNAVNPFAIAWLIGAGVVFTLGVAGYQRNMRGIVKSAVTPDETLRRSIGMAAREVGLRRIPRVLVSSKVSSPAVTGILRPSLLLPVGFPQGFNEVETRLILLHEFTHLKRHDLAVNWLACGLQALHWFNPVLWFAFAKMRADREAACDARVLAIDATDRRREYGGALLKLQSGFRSHGLSLGFVGIFERSAGMKSRIREISSHRPVGYAGRMGGAGIVALLFTFGATKAQEPVKFQTKARALQKAVEPMTKARAAIERKLDTIIIPELVLEDSTLEGALELLRNSAVKFDTEEKDPAKQGLNFVIRGARKEDQKGFKQGRITLQKKNVTLRELIIEISKQSGMGFKTDDFAVTFFAPSSKAVPGKDAPIPEPPVAKAAEFASKLIIPSIDFVGVTLQEAVDVLNQRVSELNKEGPIYPIVLDPKADAAAKIKELRIKNAPLSVALKYCMDQTKQTCTADDKEIRIQRP